MKNRTFVRSVIVATMGMLMAGCASADHGYRRHYQSNDYVYSSYEARDYGDYGRVVDARPIYRQVAVDVPSESCRVQTVARERRNGDSFTGTVVGGLVGAAIGHELGNGRGSATAVGGLIGASIGNDAGSNRSVRYRDEEVCRTQYRTEYEQRIIGYDVSYSYQGRIYQTRTDRHPGDRIAVSVAVRSRDY
jgi:uncharacterized protein YcfJ